MSGENLTDQTELTTPADADILYMVDDVAGTPVPRKVTMANFLTQTGAVAPRADNAADLGTAALAYRRLYLPIAITGGINTTFRGLVVEGTAGDIYVGSDNVTLGYYAQRVVVAGSTANDWSDDITNLYQGNGDEKVMYLNYSAGDGTVVSSPTSTGLQAMLLREGCVVQGFHPSGGGGGAGIALCSENQLTEFVAQFEDNDSTGTHADTFAMRTGGTAMGPDCNHIYVGGLDVEDFSPCLQTGAANDDAIDLGASTNRWKDGYFAGGVALNGITTVPAPATYTISNVTPLRTYNAAAPATNQQLSDLLGTLVADLRAVGLVL